MTIKPIYRIAGSKYRLLKHLTPHLQDCDTLVDVFGGSGIVSVNLKVLGVKNVIFNNYDKIDFFSDRVLINNILSFGGYGSITKLAGQNLSVRVRNGYGDRVDKYREVLKKIRISEVDYKALPIIPSAFYYLDPPYGMEKDQLYKQKTKSREFYKGSQELAKQVKKVVISLADTPEVRLEYKEWKIYQIEKTNTSGRGKKRKTTELIIISK